jgi:hypothetical protein
VYQRNKDMIDAFLRSQGIQIPASAAKDFADMDLKELTAVKESIEDLIAEMEYAQKHAEKGATKKGAAKKGPAKAGS